MKKLSDEEKARLQAKIEEARIEGTHRKQHKSGKPWEKFYTKLLQELAAYSGGRITWPNESVIDEMFVYPTLSGRLQERDFMVEVRALGTTMRMGGRWGHSVPITSAEQYIRIRIYVADFRRLSWEYNIKITHKSSHRWFDKLLLLIQLSPEFQTGNREFDQRYSVDLRSDEDRKLLLHRGIQEPIVRLESFTLLEISSSWILWSQLLTDIEQLEFAAVRGRISRVLDLADAICSLIEDQ